MPGIETPSIRCGRATGHPPRLLRRLQLPMREALAEPPCSGPGRPVVAAAGKGGQRLELGVRHDVFGGRGGQMG